MRRLFQFPDRTQQQIRADVDEEVAFHLESRIATLTALGAEPNAARAQALREFGNLGEARDELAALDIRNHVRWQWSDRMTELRQDIGYAWRALRAAPGFTLTAVLTLALGIGANIAIFSVVKAVLLEPLPFRDAGRIAQIGYDALPTVSEPEFVDLHRSLTATSQLAGYDVVDATVSGERDAEHIDVARVTDDFFSLLGTTPALGRGLTAQDVSTTGFATVVISHALWQGAFGGDPKIIGGTIHVDGEAVTVVGVMPARFDFPSTTTAMWIPLRFRTDSLAPRANHYIRTIGRLKEGATVALAAAQGNALAQQWFHDFPADYERPVVVQVSPIRERYVAGARTYLFVLLGAVAFILLIACANVASLLLAKGEARRKEFAVRVALGASTRRLITQVLTESALLSMAGGIVGALAAWLGDRVLLALAPASFPRIDQAGINVPVLLFAAALSLVTGVLFGMVPAIRASRTDPAETLKAAGKGNAVPGLLRSVRRGLVVGEIALAVTMLSGATVLIRSLWNLQAVNLGFDQSHLLTAQITLPQSAYADQTAVAYFEQLVGQIHALPGVRDAAAMGWTPIVSGGPNWSILADGVTIAAIADAPVAMPEQITPGYFGAMHTPLKAGRDFNASDRSGAPAVVIVNETMARQLWPGQSAIGHTIRMFKGTVWATVVGVAGDVRSAGIQGDIPATMYFPYAQATQSAYYTPTTMTVLVRTTGDPGQVVTGVRRAVRTLDPRVPVSSVQTMDQIVGSSIGDRRFTTLLLATFGVLALMLAVIGIYGVVSYGVSQRSHEIGVRMALGAEGSGVLRLILGEGLRMAAVGLGVGLLTAGLLGRLVGALLVGVRAFDPASNGAVAATLLLTAALASLIPAWRATRIDPTQVLRGD